MQPHEPDLSIRALVQEVLFPTHPFEFPLQQPFVVQRQDASIFFFNSGIHYILFTFNRTLFGNSTIPDFGFPEGSNFDGRIESSGVGE